MSLSPETGDGIVPRVRRREAEAGGGSNLLKVGLMEIAAGRGGLIPALVVTQDTHKTFLAS